MGYTLFQLVYGRQATLPIETILPVEPIEEEIDLNDSILQRAYELIEKLLLYYQNAKNNIEKSQQKQKEYVDKQVHFEEFEIGDKVWIQRKDIEYSCSAKFEDKRIELYIIQEKLENGAYKIGTKNGKILKGYYNSDRLAKYYETQRWEPIVVI